MLVAYLLHRPKPPGAFRRKRLWVLVLVGIFFYYPQYLDGIITPKMGEEQSLGTHRQIRRLTRDTKFQVRRKKTFKLGEEQSLHTLTATHVAFLGYYLIEA